MPATVDTSNDGPEAAGLDLAVRLTALAYLVTLALSWKAYLRHARLFARSPLVPGFASVPAAFDLPVLIVAVMALLMLALRPRTGWAAGLVLGIGVFWVCQDLLLLQPYTMMYLFTILVSFVMPRSNVANLGALRAMVSGVYFWAGFNKLNLTFLTDIFPWFVSPLVRPVPFLRESGQLLTVLGAMAALFELSIGVLLLTPRFSKLASAMAFTMLMVVTACLGPTGHYSNLIVWPWNVYLFCLEFALFVRYRSPTAPIGKRWTPVLALSVLIFMLAPGFSLFGLWPAYPSFRLYSGNIPMASVVFAPDEPLRRLPEHLDDLVADGLLPLAFWTNAELNVVVYPDEYVFKTGAAGLCHKLKDPGQALLRLWESPKFDNASPVWRDYPLCF